LTQREFAEWLVKNRKSESDIYELLTRRPEFRNLTKAEIAALMNAVLIAEFRAWAGSHGDNWYNLRANNNIPGVRALGKDSKWTNFEINNGTGSPAQTFKGYLTFTDVLRDLTPAELNAFMQELQKAGFNGQVKIAPTGARAKFYFDNIVIHGASEAEVDKAIDIAQKLFGAKLAAVNKGMDKGGKSHSELLAEAVLAQRSSLPPTPVASPVATPPASSAPANSSNSHTH